MKIMAKIFRLSLLLLMCANSLTAQVTFHSLQDVWKYADAHNITIRTARYDLEKSGYSKKAAVGALLPQVAATGSGTDNTALQTTLIPAELLGGPQGVYKSVEFGQKYIYTYGYAAQMDIINLSSWLNVRIARETESATRDSLANFRRNVYQQLATQYYSYLLTKEATRLAEKSAGLSDSVCESVQHKLEQGQANAANVDLAKINAKRARQTLITSGYQMLTAANNLKLLLDLSPNDSVVIDDAWDSATQSMQDGAFTEDPSIALASHQVTISQYQLQLAKSNFLPVISASYSNTSQQNNNTFEPFGGATWFPARYWSLKASWNLFTGGTRYFQAQRNRIAVDERKLQLDNVRKQAMVNDENLKLSYRKSVELMQNAKEVMELSLSNYGHISNRCREGLATIDDRLNAFSDYITYQNQYLNDLSDYLVQIYLIKIRQTDFK